MAITHHDQIRRRLIFGGNVILTIVIVWAIIAVANYAANKLAPTPTDLTRGGQFSISPLTVNLLEGLNDDI